MPDPRLPLCSLRSSSLPQALDISFLETRLTPISLPVQLVIHGHPKKIRDRKNMASPVIPVFSGSARDPSKDADKGTTLTNFDLTNDIVKAFYP